MSDVLYVTAEEAYDAYVAAKDIPSKLLYAWLMAEVRYAEKSVVNMYLTLGQAPERYAHKVLWYQIAMAYRDYRREIHREVLVAKPDQVYVLDPDI